MRKFALSLVALCAFVGFTIAANVTFVKWDNDKNELRVKVKAGYRTVGFTFLSNTQIPGDDRGTANSDRPRWAGTSGSVRAIR